MDKSKELPWYDDKLQFARLIAEIEAAGGFTSELLENLSESMELSLFDIGSLIGRAQGVFDLAKERL